MKNITIESIKSFAVITLGCAWAALVAFAIATGCSVDVPV